MTTVHSGRPFLPAAGHDWFLPLYDPLARLLGVDAARRTLLDAADVQPHHRVLDVGCGTGSLAVLIKRLYPSVEVIALDPDPKALARGRKKAARAGVSIRFDQGFAGALAYPDATFDRVFSSMMLHHLENDEKERMLQEVRRVLKPGGRLELLDFAGSQSGRQSALNRLLHSHHRLKDNVDTGILELVASAGFAEPRKLCDRGMIFGRVAFFEAVAPAAI
jgi:ubiquinone/menaquinone biosynthesis C-methylase UbiE